MLASISCASFQPPSVPRVIAGDEADEEDAEGLSEYRDTAVPEDLLGRTSVVQNPDPAVLETLRELNQLLGGSHMRTVNEWLRVLTQVDYLHDSPLLSDNSERCGRKFSASCRDEMLLAERCSEAGRV